MNLLPAVGRSDSRGGWIAEAEGLVVPLAEPLDGARTGLLLGFRPESIAIGPPGRYPVSAQLQLVERLGSQDVIYVSMGASRVAVVVPSRSVGLPADGQLSLLIDPASIHPFDSISGRRLNSAQSHSPGLLPAGMAKQP